MSPNKVEQLMLLFIDSVFLNDKHIESFWNISGHQYFKNVPDSKVCLLCKECLEEWNPFYIFVIHVIQNSEGFCKNIACIFMADFCNLSKNGILQSVNFLYSIYFFQCIAYVYRTYIKGKTNLWLSYIKNSIRVC